MSRVLITGGADGIGRALVEDYLASGAGVSFVDVDEARAASLDATFMPADLSRRADVDRLARALTEADPFDLVVHNAGISDVGPFESSSPERQHAVLAVNLEAPLVLTAALLGAGRISKGGAIVFVSSLSHYVGYPGASVYAATKDGLASYARSLSVALVPEGIHVMRVFPGPTRTAHARRYSPAGSDERKRMPPADVARAIVRGVERRSHVVVPGAGNRVFAAAGRWLPRTTERALKKALYDPLASAERSSP